MYNFPAFKKYFNSLYIIVIEYVMYALSDEQDFLVHELL